MARNENRAQSIARLRNKAIRAVHAGLKQRGITIPEIEGASEDDDDLRNLQEWQALERAFDDADKAAENSARAGDSASSINTYPSADTMDSGVTGKSKTPKGL